MFSSQTYFGDTMARKNKTSKDLSFYSFWKPQSIPRGEGNLVLHPLGTLEEVTKKLLRLPFIKPVHCQRSSTVRLGWGVGFGVIMQIKAPKDGRVLMISVTSGVPDHVFYRLYVQLREQFGVTVLDEVTNEFLTTKQFKSRYL
jgi:hypothetical protein